LLDDICPNLRSQQPQKLGRTLGLDLLEKLRSYI
jgi:hypothetical protein